MRMSGRNRIDPHRGEVERHATCTRQFFHRLRAAGFSLCARTSFVSAPNPTPENAWMVPPPMLAAAMPVDAVTSMVAQRSCACRMASPCSSVAGRHLIFKPASHHPRGGSLRSLPRCLVPAANLAAPQTTHLYLTHTHTRTHTHKHNGSARGVVPRRQMKGGKEICEQRQKRQGKKRRGGGEGGICAVP